MPTMDDLRVPTRSLPAEILCADGATVQGDVFLPEHSARQPGPMPPDEWVDTMHTFFPIRGRATRALTIVNRDAVVSITVPAAANADDAEAQMALPVFAVAVDAGGRRFEGDIVVDMPPGHQRVADWLNAPSPFITVRDGLAHHLIHKRHVLRVVEPDRMTA